MIEKMVIKNDTKWRIGLYIALNKFIFKFSKSNGSEIDIAISFIEGTKFFFFFLVNFDLRLNPSKYSLYSTANSKNIVSEVFDSPMDDITQV